MTATLEAITAFSARHARAVIALWVIVGAVGIAQLGTLQDDLAAGGPDVGGPAARVDDIVAKEFPRAAGTIALAVPAGPRARARTVHTRRIALAQTGVTSAAIVAPGSAGKPGVVAVGSDLSADRQANLTQTLRGQVRELGPPYVVVGGEPAFWTDATRVAKSDLGGAEKLAIPLALIALCLVFGSLAGGVLPLVSGVAAIAVGLLGIRLISHVVQVQSFAINVALLVGLGAGIDYALLMITRVRDELEEGADLHDAIRTCGGVAGHAVCVSAGALCLALAGLLAMGLSVVTGVALSTMGVVVCVATSALTLLPALIAVTGAKRLRPGRSPLSRLPRPAIVAPVLAAVQRRPVLAMVSVTAVLLVLATPLAGLHLTRPGPEVFPPGTDSRAAIRLAADALGPGAGSPVLVTVDRGTPVRRFVHVAQRVAGTRPQRIDGRTHTLLLVRVAASPGSPQTVRVLDRLQAAAPPGALIGGWGAKGQTEAHRFSARAPIALGLVIGLTMAIFAFTFGSVVIPLKAGLVNLLSVGATLGVVTWVFQGGHHTFLGLSATTDGLTDFVPIYIFSIVYGLSMDYEVFLLSRIAEHRRAGEDSRTAVLTGTAATSRVITGAATVMIAVVAPFMNTDLVFTQILGFAIAIGILLDATLVRLVLVPAVMLLLGDRAWWRPGRSVGGRGPGALEHPGLPQHAEEVV